MAHLLRLCAGYFFFYVLTGISVKWFTGKLSQGFVGMNDVEYLVYSTISSSVLCVGVVLAARWLGRVRWREIPRELAVIGVAGVCTAVIIPTTTLLFSLPFSIMVAMVIMRAGVLIVSRAVDQVLIWQGMLKKRVVWEENAAVALALAALALKAGLSLASEDGAGRHFEVLSSKDGLAILGSYLSAYFVRLYIMNYFKNAGGGAARVDNRAYFAAEQIAATATMAIAAAALYLAAGPAEAAAAPTAFLEKFALAFGRPHTQWFQAVVGGLPFGMVAFFSVFIFMLRGHTATFAGLANRLTSLIAGTTATLVTWAVFGGELPGAEDWVSLLLIFGAVALLYRSETRARAAQTGAAR